MKLLTPNTMIQGRYLVVQLIGKGGMGEVYLAVDQRLGSAVALKRTSFAEDANLAAAFEREAKILARLRHPVLPKVSDHFLDNGDQFLVMEHISGDDLSNRLENAGKAFPLSWVMFWADQLLDALSYLHSHEPPIIHRDIKPQNLKLTDENHIVLLDFGLSKDTATLTVSEAGKSGSIVGYTPHFAPMEQIRGTGTNARSDVYSLSATLYQLMTNLVPPDALSRADMMLGSQRDPIRALFELNPAISQPVSDVILKGLEVSQEKRFATASEMQKALRAAYAQIQTAMSADTAVFTIGDQPGADLHSTTPPLDTAAPVAPSEMQTMIPQAQFVTAGREPVVEAVLADGEAAAESSQHLEATKTEEAALDAEQKVADEPLAKAAELSSPPESEQNSSIPERAVAASAAAALSSPAPSPGAKSIAAPPYKKKSRSGMFVGGIIGLLLLAGLAGGGGWFAYTRYYLPSKTKAAPSPTVEVSPTPQPTVPVVAEVDQNSNSNSTAGPVTETNSSTDNSNRSIVTGGPTTRATPQVVTKSTPAQAIKPPTAKATPKTKGKDDRTVILQ